MPAESVRPLQGCALLLAIGISIASLTAGSNILFGNTPWSMHIAGFLIFGNAIAFLSWGADRLWFSSLAPLLRKPFSWFGYLTRVPFWYFSGAAGSVLSLLSAKKLDLLTVYD